MFPSTSAGKRSADSTARGRAGRTMRLTLPLAAALTAAGCARAPGPPVKPPPAPPAGYERFLDDPDSADVSGLRGRRIVLDPGHGGFFRGSIGVGGLTEAEVNLGVALLLRDRLVAAGAEVLMTRQRDRDFLSPSDSTLRTDLNTRVRMAAEFEPDAFVSIHHNADPAGRHDVNETVTYYRLGDDGPSLDLAESVHRALVRNVGIRPQRIVPGNYAVLRGSAAAAILTETSYLTYPPVEAKLKLPEARRIEAGALFVGLARYFARRGPEVATLEAFDARGEADTVFTRARPMLRASVRGAFDEAELRLDGERVEPDLAADGLAWTPRAPLSRGSHEATLRVRLAGRGTSAVRRLRFRVDTPVAKLVADFPGQDGWDGAQLLGLRVSVLDASGLPYRDTLTIRVRAGSGAGMRPRDTLVVADGGIAWSYLRRAPGAARRTTTGPVRVSRAGGARDSSSATATLRAAPAGTRGRFRSGFALRAPGGETLREAPGTSGAEPRVSWINRDGFFVLPRDADLPRLDGFRPALDDTSGPPRFAAWLGGALHGKRIVLDPDGGGDQAGGGGPGGARGASLNLAVARALAAMLEAAGADVLLTRDGDYAVSEVERVQRTERFRPDRFVRIGHRAEPPLLGYYFSSAAGLAWARRTSATLGALSLPAPPPGECAQYPIQQVSCPALYAGFARVDSTREEERLLAPGTLRAEAYALLAALAREGADTTLAAVDSIEVRDAAGAPVAGAAVRIGGALVLETDALGRARFVRGESGAMEVVVDDPRVSARIVLLDSSRSTVLTGTPGR